MFPSFMPWAGRLTVCALWAGLVAGAPSCPRASEALTDTPADRLYNRACGHVERGHLDLAFELLESAFGNGLARPMQVAVDLRLAPLLADTVWRPRIRDLIHRHAWDEEAVMAAPGRPGERVLIHLRFLDEAGAAVTRTVVDLWQGDENRPCALEGDWNPVLFASLRSGDSGRVAVETTLPPASGHVPGGPASSHLHVSIERNGFEAVRGLLVLEVDAGSLASEGPDASSGTWIAMADPQASGRRIFRAELRLKRTP